MYLNTVTSTENYILVTANITEWNKKKLRLIITCNNRLATVVEFLAKKIFFVNITLIKILISVGRRKFAISISIVIMSGVKKISIK